MRDEEIKEKIASFPRWYYEFDLKGNLTPVPKKKRAKRHEQRKQYFFDPLVRLFGGSLAGKRVLDLGCNAGFWSLSAVRAGCDYVLGIDDRRMNVDQASFVFEVKEIERDRYDFVKGDLFEVDFREFGSFDVVLCLGLLHHVNKPVELMKKISEINDDVLLIDAELSTLPGLSFEVERYRVDGPGGGVDSQMGMIPTWEAVHDLTREFEYEVAALEPRFDGYEGLRDYRKGRRRAFLCAKRTNLSRVSAKTEPAPDGREEPGRASSGEKGAGRLENLMRQTDHALSELFVSRRWRLANVLGDAGRRALRKDRGPTAEDRLLVIRNEFRAWSEEPERNPAEGEPDRERG